MVGDMLQTAIKTVFIFGCWNFYSFIDDIDDSFSKIECEIIFLYLTVV